MQGVWGERLPMERQRSPKGGAQADSVGRGWGCAALAGGQAVRSGLERTETQKTHVQL